LLNRFDSFAASAPSGGKAWKTVAQPLAPAAPPAPAALPAPDAQSSQTPQPLAIPVAATRSVDASGTNLAASGSINRTVSSPGGSAGGGGRMGGGGMGGGGMGRGGGMGGGRMSGASSSNRSSTKVTTTITLAAYFNRDGELMSATIAETNQTADDQSPSMPGGQPSTLSWQIERL
jgi:hypothetical protein